jgi:hypothetical protein
VMSEPSYDEYRKAPGRARWDDEVRQERRREQSRRAATAQSRALTALSHLHDEDYRRFYRAAVDEIRKELGSLPGDPA